MVLTGTGRELVWGREALQRDSGRTKQAHAHATWTQRELAKAQGGLAK